MGHDNVTVLGEGSAFDRDYRQLMWAVDVLAGDDPQSNSIVDHGMVDADARKHELPAPDVYQAKKADSSLDNKNLDEQFGLSSLSDHLGQVLFNMPFVSVSVRGKVLSREIKIAELRIADMLAGTPGVKKPKFNDLWYAVTGRNPPRLVSLRPEVVAIKDHLLTLLGRAGVTVTNPRTLKARLMEWEMAERHFGVGDEKEI